MRLHTLPLINFNSREQDKIPIYNFCWCKYYHLHYNWSIPFGVQGTGTKWNLNCTLKTSKTRYKHVSILCGFPSITTSCSSSFLLNNTFRKEIKMLYIYPHKNYKYKEIITRDLNMHPVNILLLHPLFPTAKVQIWKAEVYQEMMTSCAVPVLHSSSVLYNQTPWYLPRLQDNAAKGKNCYVEMKMPANVTMQKTSWSFFQMVIPFKKEINHWEVSKVFIPRCAILNTYTAFNIFSVCILEHKWGQGKISGCSFGYN